jgi:hypothetical protein
MKRPYLNQSEREAIRMGVLIGALCELDLRVKQLIRAICQRKHR